MAESLTFDEKIKGLADYYQQLVEIDPKYNSRLEIPFYSSGHAVSDGLRAARESLKFHVGTHARIEYGNRGFGKKDLRDDSPEEREQRAGVLAMATVPENEDIFFSRTEDIREMIEKVVLGETIAIAEHRYDQFLLREQPPVAVDTNRSIFLTFDNSHVSTRSVSVYYDRPGRWIEGVSYETEDALRVLLPSMFDGVVSYPDSEAA